MRHDVNRKAFVRTLTQPTSPFLSCTFSSLPLPLPLSVLAVHIFCLKSLNLLPPNALVSLITFGKNVAVHELSASDISRSYMFKAKKNPKNEKEYLPYATADVAKLLNINPAASRNAMGVPSNNAATSAARFIQPVSECEFVFESILDDLQRDPWPKVAGQRPQRVSGVALNVASSLLEATSAYVGARIMLFLGGPPTEGTGRIAGSMTSEFMRQHVDIEKNNTPYLKEAQKFYKEVSEKCVKNNHAVDMFACSLDQIGLLELQPCIQATGGLIVLADSFGQSVFKESFRRLFRKSPEGSPDAGNLMMGFAANMEVLTSSREFKINGAIGPCSSLKKDGPCVSEVELGEGKTNAWSLGSIFSSTTVGLYFEVVNLHTNPLPVGHRWHLQFITNYQASNGGYRIRVTTLNGPWHNDEKNRLPLQMGFDQEAASVLTARLASYKTETESREDVLRWVDRGLIRLCKKFADYRENEVNSFQLANEFRIFPQFMFHLRRSQFLNYFNSSPDESTYYRLMLRRENTTNSLVMIQPALLSYSFHGPPQPVLLDACSVASDTILLLDTFFHVVVFHGTTIAMWKAAGYHEQPDHVHFKNLLQAPRTDAQLIMEERFPVPRYILCDEGKSESRFLMAKLNPSVTHNNRDGAHAPIFTEDVSLRIFMEHLMKLTVSPA